MKLGDDIPEYDLNGRPLPTPVALEINRVHSPLELHGMNSPVDLLGELWPLFRGSFDLLGSLARLSGASWHCSKGSIVFGHDFR